MSRDKRLALNQRVPANNRTIGDRRGVGDDRVVFDAGEGVHHGLFEHLGVRTHVGRLRHRGQVSHESTPVGVRFARHQDSLFVSPIHLLFQRGGFEGGQTLRFAPLEGNLIGIGAIGPTAGQLAHRTIDIRAGRDRDKVLLVAFFTFQ